MANPQSVRILRAEVDACAGGGGGVRGLPVVNA